MKKIVLSVLLLSFLMATGEAKEYSQKDMDHVLKRLDVLEKQTQKDMDELYERVDDNEFQATLNRIKWGGELEIMDSNIDSKEGSSTTQNGKEYSRSNLLSTRLRLSMTTIIRDDLKFHGRLSMYKNWSAFNTQTLPDFAQGRKPNGNSNLYVERAYVDYSPFEMLTFTLGRQPSSDGPGMTLIENTKRKATYPSLLFDGAEDGAIVTFKMMPKSNINPLFRVAYGKAFQDSVDYSNYSGNKLSDDSNVYGFFYEMSLPTSILGDNLLVLSYVRADDLVGNPLQADANTTKDTKSLGNMSLAGVYFENNHVLGSNLNYFISAGWSMPDSNDNSVTLIDSTGTAMPPMKLLSKNGDAIHVGVRYDFDFGLKLGYEYNHGSKYWFSFTSASTDLLNKLSTRGSVNDVYAIYQIDINQFIRIGYTDIEYEYTGSGWQIGEPRDTDDFRKRSYFKYNLRF